MKVAVMTNEEQDKDNREIIDQYLDKDLRLVTVYEDGETEVTGMRFKHMVMSANESANSALKRDQEELLTLNINNPDHHERIMELESDIKKYLKSIKTFKEIAQREMFLLIS